MRASKFVELNTEDDTTRCQPRTSTVAMSASLALNHSRAINLPAAEYEAAGLAEVAVAPAATVIEALRLEAAAATERPTKCA
jgi:hypothetical protein